MFRERMMGILGHDLRSPLNAITMAASLLRRRTDLPERVRDQALRIDHAGRRMAEMIRTLLDFAQARFRGALPISRVSTNLAEIAREAVEELRTAWPGRRIDLMVRGDARGTWDPARIAQVISNIAANALTHGASGAPVDMVVDGAGTEVRLTVHNAGPAIPPDLIQTLSEVNSGGVGLGLYIARQIVLAHEGDIEVSSSDPEGTRVTFRLPRTVSDEIEKPAA
jgi:signal transduction histidine kinase